MTYLDAIVNKNSAKRSSLLSIDRQFQNNGQKALKYCGLDHLAGDILAARREQLKP